MIRTKKPRLLAIDPGTRNLGFALFERDELLHYGVKSITRHHTPHETLKAGRKFILTLLDDFRPTTLAIERAFFANNRNVALLNVFVDEICSLAKHNGIKVIRLAPSTVKKTVAGNGRAGKHEVAKVVVSRFPELKVFISQDRKWKARYHSNMFDAVAIGLAAME